MSNESFCLVLCTFPTFALAKALAQTTVSEKLAACVNLSSALTALYAWEGKVDATEEFQAIFKTSRRLEPELKKLVFEHHPYKIPEWIILDVADGDSTYFNWWQNALLP